MKRILIIFLAALMFCSCTFNFTPGSDNPSETPSTDPDNTPSTDKPNANIPDIPGAPDINTDQNYVTSYLSFTANGDSSFSGGPTNIATDVLAIFNEALSTLITEWNKQHGEMLIGETINAYDETLTLETGLNCHFVSGMNSIKRPYINTEFSFTRYTITYSNDTFTIWGTMYSEVSPNVDWKETYSNSNISIIVVRNGRCFSFVSTDFTFDSSVFSGTAYINGDLYYFTLNFQQ